MFVSHEGVFLWILDVQGDMTQDRANIFSDDDEDLVRKFSKISFVRPCFTCLCNKEKLLLDPFQRKPPRDYINSICIARGKLHISYENVIRCALVVREGILPIKSVQSLSNLFAD